MKRVLVLFLLLPVFVKAQSWQWVAQAIEAAPKAIATDPSGNTYIVGSFGVANSPGYIYDSVAVFGSLTLSNAGGSDVFIAKYSPAGNFLWVRTAGGAGNDQASSVAIDASGNVYITGSFDSASSIIAFGDDTLYNSAATYSAGNMFLVKYDASGNVLWAKSANGTRGNQGNAVTTDAVFDIYVTGFFSGPSLTLDTLTVVTADSLAPSNIFIAKYDSSGRIIWVKNPTDGEGNALSIDISGNIYLAGEFRGSVTWGSDTISGSSIGDNSLLIKYGSLGNIIWARCSSYGFSDYASSVTTDSTSNVYFGGGIYNDGTGTYGIDFGSSFVPLGAAAEGLGGFYLAKYDSSGNIQWISVPKGGGEGYGTPSLDIDGLGNIYFANYFESHTITFGAITLDNPYGHTDIFLAKYNSLGNVLWAKSFDGGNQGASSIVATDLSDNVYLSGYFGYPGLNLGDTTLYCNHINQYSMFLAKMDSINATGIKPIYLYAPDITIFPNPASTLLMISAHENITAIAITNLLGQTVLSQQCNATQVEVNVADLPSGVYFVKVNPSAGSGRVLVRKFVKE